MPRVAMNGTTRRVVIATPLMNPTTAPIATPAATAAIGANPSRNATAVITLASAIDDPTDKSIPPLIITMVIPRAPIATMTVCASTTRRFVVDR